MIRIYKAYHKDEPNMTYVGKTKSDIQVRLYQHFMDRHKVNSCMISKMMRGESFDNFRIELLEETSTELAREREQYWISQIGVINQNNAIRNPDYNKQYQEQNKPWLKRDKQRHASEELKRYTDNKDFILTKLKLARVVCDCGVEVRKQHLKRHQQSKVHLYLKSSSEASPEGSAGHSESAPTEDVSHKNQESPDPTVSNLPVQSV